MSAGKHGYKSGGRTRPLTEDERMWRLSRQVGLACDEWQMRVNGYKPKGFREIINTSVLKAQSEKDNE